MKRNLINEINGIKSRTEFNSRHDINLRLNNIEIAFAQFLNNDEVLHSELLKYIPIATVACFEAFFRSVIKELIDFGKPFNENALQFNQSKNVKFDFDIILAIQSKTVTIGEFISHILPCNNYDDINSNLSTLAGIDFTKTLKNFKRDSISEHTNKNSELFRNNSDQIISDIKKTFELRHIFCHEFATSVKVDKDEIIRCFKNSKIFLEHVNDFIWQLLHPNAPESQIEMNIKSANDFEYIENELSELITKIKGMRGENHKGFVNQKLFDKSIVEWKKYRTAKADADASIYKGGTIYPTISAMSSIWTTKEKIESLKDEFQHELRKYTNL
ncbi:lysozyme inhibitor LprI family protein [Flavobacterium pedocola]